MLLICGYRRTGKDVLFNNLIGKGEFKFRVYSNKSGLVVNPDGKRFAFADKLKEEVVLKYNIPIDIIDKDVIQFDNKSFRDLCIEHANYTKTLDPNYWCKYLTEITQVISSETHTSLTEITCVISSNPNCIITDWRFICELDYVKNNFENFSTVRVFRSSVSIPSIDVISEHELDTILTDFLVVSDDDLEFDAAIKCFPQYQNYYFINFI